MKIFFELVSLISDCNSPYMQYSTAHSLQNWYWNRISSTNGFYWKCLLNFILHSFLIRYTCSNWKTWKRTKLASGHDCLVFFHQADEIWVLKIQVQSDWYIIYHLYIMWYCLSQYRSWSRPGILIHFQTSH